MKWAACGLLHTLRTPGAQQHSSEHASQRMTRYLSEVEAAAAVLSMLLHYVCLASRRNPVSNELLV